MLGYVALGAVTILVFLFVIQPLLTSRGQTALIVPARIADLRARREYLTEAILDVDFDYQSGKIGDEEYEETRGRYLREAALVVRDLDRESQLVDQEIEEEIARLRALARGRQTERISDPS